MKNLVVANWKMNPTTQKEAKLLFDSVKREIRKVKNVKIVICPPFPYLYQLFCDRKKVGISLGAQDCFWEERGAFTGEISPKMLKNLGCQYVILGHSERRKYLGETNEMINKKIKASLKIGLKPILCIGETEKERKSGKTFKVLQNQLNTALKNYPGIRPQAKLIVAYEPVWAIGTGNPCHPRDGKMVLLFLRKILKENQILYGGSVNAKNARDYIENVGFQGLLVGSVSLNAKEFVQLVKNISQAKRYSLVKT